MQTAQRVTEVALSEAASVRGKFGDRVQTYMLRTEVSVSHVVGDITQQLEQECKPQRLAQS